MTVIKNLNTSNLTDCDKHWVSMGQKHQVSQYYKTLQEVVEQGM